MKRVPILILSAGVIGWLIWPAFIHYVEKCHTFLEITFLGETPSRVEEQQMSGTYVTFNALLTLITATIAVSTYLKTREREIQHKVQALEMSTFSRFFSLYDNFENNLNNLEYKGYKGKQVIDYFYKKYRMKELTYIAGNRQEELIDMDKCFQQEANDAKLFLPAMKIFSIFNWIRALDFYCETTKNTKYFDKNIYLNTLDNLINAKSEFVFGKFRHHFYEVEKMALNDEKFRGTQYADFVLKYERTLIGINSLNTEIVANIKSRYEQEEKNIPEEIRLIFEIKDS